MALIRGLRGNFPCPICLVPQDMQHDLTLTYDLRTAKDTQRILKDADKLQYGYQREELVKSKGLRYIKASLKFSLLKFTDDANTCIECILVHAKIRC
jgi:hypothetical protein